LGHLPERLTENVFKRISANSNLIPNPKAQKRFRENKMTSFFGQVSTIQENVFERQDMQ